MTHDGTGSEAGRDAIGKTRRFNKLKTQTKENSETAGGDTERRKPQKSGQRTYRKGNMFSRV